MIDNLLATSAHNVVQQGGDFDYNNGPFVFPIGNDGALLNPFHVPHAAQAADAGEVLNEDHDIPQEEEAEESEDSDADDYMTFTAAELLDRFYEYKQVYRVTRRHRNVAEAQVVEFSE